MHESGKTGRMSAAKLGGAPAQVIAEIAAGVTRQRSGDIGAPRSAS
jgi:hypothetical protein